MRKIIIVSIMFVFTSCTVNYNIEINDDNIKEETLFYVLKSEMSNDVYQQQIDVNIKSYINNKDSIYKLKVNEKNDYYIFNYSYKFPINKYKQSFFLNSCYTDVNIELKKNILIINTSDKFNCLNVDGGKVNEMKINIITKNKVNKNNADKINNDRYTWIINSKNSNNKSIYIAIDLSNKKNKYFYKKIIFIGIILSLLTFIVIYISKKMINKNSV